MSVSLVVHVCQGLKEHSILIKDASLLEVSLSVGDSTSRHIDPSADLDALLVPKRPEVVISDPTLTFRPVQKIELDNIVLIQQVKFGLSQFDVKRR